MKFTIAFLPCLVAVTPAGFAHPGGLNAQGCHNNRKTGDYHCHRAGAESRCHFGPQVREKEAAAPTCRLCFGESGRRCTVATRQSRISGRT